MPSRSLSRRSVYWLLGIAGVLGVAVSVFVALVGRPAGSLEVLNGEAGDEIGIGITMEETGQPATVLLSSLCTRGSPVDIDAVVPAESTGIRVTNFAVVTLTDSEVDAWTAKPLGDTISGDLRRAVSWDCDRTGRPPALMVEIERTSRDVGRVTDFEIKHRSGSHKAAAVMRYGIVACPIDIFTEAGQERCAKDAPF